MQFFQRSFIIFLIAIVAFGQNSNLNKDILILDKENTNDKNNEKKNDEKEQETLKDVMTNAAIVGAGSTATAGAVATGGLWAAGFSSIGPVAGSLAASTQATIGNVVAGSMFSFFQATAMGGAMAIAGPAMAVGGIATVVYLGYKGSEKLFEERTDD